MTKASTNIPRRSVLASSTAAIMAATVVLVPKTSAMATMADDGDGELLRACAHFEALECQLIAILDGPNAIADDNEAAGLTEPLRTAQFGVLDILDTLPTHTEAGLRARLRLLSVHNSHGQFNWNAPGTISGRLLQQVLREGAVVSPAHAVANHPDAELIALAAEAVRLEGEYARLCWATDQQSPRYQTAERPAAEAEFEAVDAAQVRAFERLGHLRATTAEGAQAKARAIKAWYGNDEPTPGDVAGPALWSLIVDLAGEGGAG